MPCHARRCATPSSPLRLHPSAPGADLRSRVRRDAPPGCAGRPRTRADGKTEAFATGHCRQTVAVLPERGCSLALGGTTETLCFLAGCTAMHPCAGPESDFGSGYPGSTPGPGATKKRE
jgi:hypothetical protein